MTRTGDSPAIRIRGLRKSYGKLRVLEGVDLEVAPGTICALLGSNGAGKTTAIRILATLLKPDGGTAAVAGRDVVREPAAVRSAISLTGQFTAVDDVLTGRENLELVARLRHLPSVKTVANDLLQGFTLVEAADRAAGGYSGGMKRRLDLAMSLVGDPQVIFLDEPTTGLDPEGRAEVWEAVRALRAGGTTILLTTQYLEEAEQLADQVAILHGGVIIADGTLAELKAMFPPAKVEYVEKQPSLEEIFLAITGNRSSVAQVAKRSSGNQATGAEEAD
jgi:ABC-2 type transport system ATP-binding protein